MRAGAGRRAWLTLLLISLIFAGGCYSSDYSRQTAATATMLRDLAAKLGDYCRAGFKAGNREISSEEMGEFYYGLNKARSYAAQASSHSSRQSYRDLIRLLDDYRQMLNAADRYRLAGKPDPQRLRDILDRQSRVKAQAKSVLEDLRNRD